MKERSSKTNIIQKGKAIRKWVPVILVTVRIATPILAVVAAKLSLKRKGKALLNRIVPQAVRRKISLLQKKK